MRRFGSIFYLFMAAALTFGQDSSEVDNDFECDGQVHFELITGYVFSAAYDIIDTKTRTLNISECIEYCRYNDDCLAINYETGLCVLFKSSAGENSAALDFSQIPIFTLYAQKVCLPEELTCQVPWAYETTPGLAINKGYAAVSAAAKSRKECALMCLREKTFACRAASYSTTTGLCTLSALNRNMAGRKDLLSIVPHSDLVELACSDMPQSLCEFQPIRGRILKTVDSVFEHLQNADECRKKCLEAPFSCHTYDYMSAGEKVCRLSHHSASTLTHIEEPYIEVPNTTTYELNSCYHVNVECRGNEMKATIRTSGLFEGKVYAKSRPNSCVVDVHNATNFDIVLPYNDINCDVTQEGESLFSSDIIIQHHDMIVTSADLGLALHCKYDLQNTTVTNSLLSGLEVKEGIETEYVQETIVSSPNVTMRITTPDGEDVLTAQVGDDLALRFEILDANSPYEIFVRDLVAMDGQDSAEILLLDVDGCPTDVTIMKGADKIPSTKHLTVPFQAFKFPSSDVVQFRALVTPCLPRCEPSMCTPDAFRGVLPQFSYGKKKRSLRTRREVSDSSLLVAKSVRITDKFSFRDALENQVARDLANDEDTCGSFTAIVVASALFILTQVVVLVVWSYLWHKKKATKELPPIHGVVIPELMFGTLHSRNSSTAYLTH